MKITISPSRIAFVERDDGCTTSAMPTPAPAALSGEALGNSQTCQITRAWSSPQQPGLEGAVYAARIAIGML